MTIKITEADVGRRVRLRDGSVEVVKGFQVGPYPALLEKHGTDRPDDCDFWSHKVTGEFYEGGEPCDIVAFVDEPEPSKFDPLSEESYFVDDKPGPSPLDIEGLEIIATSDVTAELIYRGRVSRALFKPGRFDNHVARFIAEVDAIEPCQHTDRTETGGRIAWCNGCGAKLAWSLEGGWR